MICDGCKREIFDGQHYMELGVVLKTAGSPFPVAINHGVINIHYVSCFDRYCYANTTIQDVFGR